MARITIDPDILRSASKKISTQIGELNSYNTKLNGLLEEIHTKWKGEASNSYYDLMLSYKAKATTMESVLTKFKNYADKAVDKFETLDQESAKKIRNSF